MKINDVTPFVRQCIALWLASNRQATFSVSEVCKSLQDQHKSLQDLDLTKSVSNELIRLETIGLLSSRKGFKGESPNETGRPPRVYKRVYCEQSLKVLRSV